MKGWGDGLGAGFDLIWWEFAWIVLFFEWIDVRLELLDSFEDGLVFDGRWFANLRIGLDEFILLWWVLLIVGKGFEGG